MVLTMTNEEREAFLADVHVAVISVAEDGHGPLVVPVWYSYEPGARCESSPVGRRERGNC
jgi:nitroimidazol reductase NimA-like FMN-containing flavoprotein (pyridoxamine 5'-phosphate oxidase superfamily)